VSERFYEAVVAHPGQTMAFLAAKLELRPQELHRPMDLLRQAQKIRSVGQRNFTKYFPMVDGEVAAA
jgi:predicted transcriptional regulator